MIRTVAVQGYRSLRELTLPLGQLSVITGANGSGKSSVYRSLRLLADAALNSVVASVAREGGLPSTFWAGPETIARSVRQGTHNVEPLAKRSVASLKLGFGSDDYSYCIDLGYPPPAKTMFGLDPTSSANADGEHLGGALRVGDTGKHAIGVGEVLGEHDGLFVPGGGEPDEVVAAIDERGGLAVDRSVPDAQTDTAILLGRLKLAGRVISGR